MPSYAEEVFKRLIERNPEADLEDLKVAFEEAALEDPKLRIAVIMDMAEHYWNETEARSKREKRRN